MLVFIFWHYNGQPKISNGIKRTKKNDACFGFGCTHIHRIKISCMREKSGKQQQKWRNDIFSSVNVYLPSNRIWNITKVIQNLSLSLYAKRQVKCQKTTNCMRKKHTRKISINLSKLYCNNNILNGHIPSCVSSCVWKFASNCISRSSILCVKFQSCFEIFKKKSFSVSRFAVSL